MQAVAFAPIEFNELAVKGFDWQIVNAQMEFQDPVRK